MTAIKKITSLACYLIFSYILCACSATPQPDNTATIEYQSPQYHIGPISAATLRQQYPLFAKSNSAEQSSVSADDIAQLAKQLDQGKIVVVFGTWCPDSQREVPRLLSLLDKVREQHGDIDFELSLIGAAPYAKRDLALSSKYQLTGVPTIILFHNDQEVGRIVERTQVSMAADIINMTL